ncbi:MAG TPA: hypothetical protein VLG68_04215 [Gammaproteobacteria bacterium]|nr:hypothetical protein [Gammaproteobacteria bacterium]
MALLLALTACALLRPSPMAVPDKALVYVYRQALPLGPGGGIRLSDGKDVVAVLPAGSYTYFYTLPGPRALKAENPGMSSLPYATSFITGQTYYLLVYVLGDQATGDIRLAPVDASTAHFQMQNLKPVTANSGH